MDLKQAQGAYIRQAITGHDFVMAKPKNLRRPIQSNINGKSVTLLTSGYMARAIGRSTWSVKHWRRLGLLPQPPFVLHADVQESRRYLYPATFVKCLAEIAREPYVIRRLERNDWERFHREVSRAYEKTIVPLLTAGVIDDADSMVHEDERRQASTALT